MTFAAGSPAGTDRIHAPQRAGVSGLSVRNEGLLPEKKAAASNRNDPKRLPFGLFEFKLFEHGHEIDPDQAGREVFLDRSPFGV